jgi:hypothetical protein
MSTTTTIKPSKQNKANKALVAGLLEDDEILAGEIAKDSAIEAVLAAASAASAAQAGVEAASQPEVDAAKAKADEQRRKALEIEAQIDSEIKALTDAEAALMAAAGKVKALGLERLAKELGESTSRAGRPSFKAWHRFVLALVATNRDFNTQNRLAAMANKHVPYYDTTKPVTVAKTKAKGETGGANCSYRINKPVAWDIAVGE